MPLLKFVIFAGVFYGLYQGFGLLIHGVHQAYDFLRGVEKPVWGMIVLIIWGLTSFFGEKQEFEKLKQLAKENYEKDLSDMSLRDRLTTQSKAAPEPLTKKEMPKAVREFFDDVLSALGVSFEEVQEMVKKGDDFFCLRIQCPDGLVKADYHAGTGYFSASLWTSDGKDVHEVLFSGNTRGISKDYKKAAMKLFEEKIKGIKGRYAKAAA